MKKYELTDETKVVFGHTLHRIKAIVSFGAVEAGDIGGWIEKEENLDQTGNAWVYDNARVYGDALVYGDARVCGDARVYDNARVYGDALVYGDARVCGNAWVYGDAKVCGNAWVCGNAEVCGNAWVYGIGAIFWVSGIGSRNGTTTFFACKDKKIRVSCGCFFGTLDEFRAKVAQTHGDNRHAKVYLLAAMMAEERIDLPSIPVEEEKSAQREGNPD